MNIELIKQWIASLNMTKLYLVLANVILAVFAIWFSNVGLLPFSSLSDFGFFFVLGLVLALYRPSWTFALFVGTLALENINFSPKGLGLAIRPYQFFALVTIIALFVQMFSKRLAFPLPKWKWQDLLPVLFVLAGLLSSLGAPNKGMSFKQAIVAASFVAIYFLVRVYIQSWEDLKRVAPFFLSNSLIVLLYSIWQNVRFLNGANSFEVMPGRPNGTFTEADWLGIYLVFLLSIILTIIYSESIKTRISNLKFPIFNKFSINQFFNAQKLLVASYWLLVTLTVIVLILTVSRSAWVGAVIVMIGFWKVVLYGGSLRISTWHWKSFFWQVVATLFIIVASAGVSSKLTNFQIFNRVQSTGGQQKITVACQGGIDYNLPKSIGNISELEKYNCRHINLEDIEKEKKLGNFVTEIFRTDPTVNIRAEIYQKSIEQIKAHPVFGIGWGTISSILGKDERGAGLNASNIFLEIYLGAGFLGIASFVILLLWIFAVAVKKYLSNDSSGKMTSVFVLMGWAAIVVPNLFNSGIFLGFVWAYLAVAVSLLTKNLNVNKNIKK